MQQPCEHQSVLLHQAVDALITDAQGRYVDATFGRGGHARHILERLDATARLTAFDKDPQAARCARQLQDQRLTFQAKSFTAISQLPAGSLAGILMDLGVSSPQLDQAERGFSFRLDGPLDMRMNPAQGPSVAQWLAEASERQIAEVIHDYGEERFARSIAKAIVQRRAGGAPVQTTGELAQLVAAAVRTRQKHKHPATRTFQAFRIYINGELEELAQALEASLKVLRPGGRLVVISFHSLEDRMVKQFMRRHSRPVVDRRLPFVEPAPVLLRVLSRTRPSAQELEVNVRARSAIMRVAERTEALL